MQRMSNISLTRKELNNLLKHSYARGSEGIVCESDTKNTLYKIFSSGKKIIPMCENKERKITKLYELKLEDSVRPLKTISHKGNLIGYEMTYDKDDVRYYPTNHNRNERIEFLKITSKILKYFSTKNIIYGDVAYRNILYNNKTEKFKFCDMDNIQIDDYPIDLVGNNSALFEYEKLRKIDKYADAYMHNILVTDTLGIGISLGFDDEIEYQLEHPAIEILDSMQDPRNFQGEYIVQYIKR